MIKLTFCVMGGQKYKKGYNEIKSFKFRSYSLICLVVQIVPSPLIEEENPTKSAIQC